MSADLTMWSSEAWSSAADVQLLARSREGSAEAFGELWRRHLPAAYAVARRYRGRTSPDDVVAEAAARVFSLIRDGRGPEEHFRAYFLSAVRTVALDAGSRDLRLVPTEEEDLDALAEPVDQPEPDLGDDETVALVREAFRSLPEKDQRVLWHTTVEGAAPRVVAPSLGMTANAVSVRAMRARENLRALYLDARAERGLSEADTDECRWTITHLGALVRGRLPKRQTERARAHVASCSHAARIAADLRVIHDGFPALLVPLVLAAGVSTPGFVTAGGLGLVGGAAGAAGAGAAGVVGGGGAAGGVAGAGAPPGSSVAAAGASGASGVGRLGSGADALAQVASRVASVVAGVAVTAGATGLLGAPASTTLPAGASPRPSVSASPSPGTPSVPGAPGTAANAGAAGVATAVPSVAARVARGLTGTPAPPAPGGAAAPAPGGVGAGSTDQTGVTVAPGPSDPAGSAGSTGSGGSGGDTPATRPPASSTPPAVSSPPAPPPTTPPAPPTTPPSPPPTTDPSPQPSSPPTMTVKVIATGDPSRFTLSVRTTVEGRLRISVANASGAGSLVASNSAWTCSNTSASRVTCSGSASAGRMQLTQGGLGGLGPVLVTVTDGAGDTYRRTFFG